MDQQRLWDSAERLRGSADEAARLVQNFYISFLLLGTYIAVIIGSTTDMQLLKVIPVTLPLLNVQLPIVGFYVFVPWLMLLFYFNLLLHLTLLAQKLHRLNAVLTAFTDEAAREEQRVRLFPFPFSAMLIGRPDRWSLRMLLSLMVWTTILLLPLMLLLWAQVRFLPYHDTVITWSHRCAVLADLLLVWVFWPLMLMPAQYGGAAAREFPLWREEQRQRAAQRITRKVRNWWGLGLICLSLLTVVFSLSIVVLPQERMERLMASLVPKPWRYVDPTRASDGVFMLSYWLFESPGAPFHRNLWLPEQVLVEGAPSAEVRAALQSEDETKRAQGLEKITGLILTNRDLRGANLRATLLAKADLRGANLKGANLSGARVFAAKLSTFSTFKGGFCAGGDRPEPQPSDDRTVCQSNLEGADLQYAQFQGADLSAAQLQRADLSGAELQGANLEHAQLQVTERRVSLGGAKLQGANLKSAELQGVILQYAQLQKADLQYAQLQGADLKFAELQGANLSAAQLQEADLQYARLQGAELHGTGLEGAKLRGAELQGANLSAQLQGADLRSTQLQGADLSFAQLQGASWSSAQLQGANLESAELQGADLQDSEIGSANFTNADLTLSNLRAISQAPLDKETYEEVKGILTHAINDADRRNSRLERIEKVIGQDTQLKVRSAKQVLCDTVNLFRSCLTQEKVADYADARAVFLVRLGCNNPAIARGVEYWHRVRATEDSQPMRIAFAKSFTAIQEQDCPGWASLPAYQKDWLRNLAAEKP